MLDNELQDMQIDAVAVIYFAANCPTCTGFDFSHLVWFDTMQDLCNFVIEQTNDGYKIEKLYNTKTKKNIQDIKLDYVLGRHCVDYVLVTAPDLNLRIKRHPYQETRFVFDTD